MTGTGVTAPEAFVVAHTRLGPPPLVPEIRLHLAADAFSLWERTEQDAGQAQLPPPFWAFPWAGGQALARYLLDEPALVRGRTVLDVASGSGLVAIAAARSGAAAVTASDTDPLSAAAIRLNCAANGVGPVTVLGDVLDSRAPATDVVLAGDAFYERSLARRLLALLERAHAAGALVLVGDPGRAYLPRDRFEQAAAYDVPVSRVLEDTDVKATTVWRLPHPARGAPGAVQARWGHLGRISLAAYGIALRGQPPA